ncbi:FAD-dependent oxidoreductase [Nocardia sp. SYP-A9097]|uniref:FAD-dependent monooxygenase n=1 Tax=Nocardia sp. SYP-A9097 TaxID=2663237 RepID=UPI00129A5A56|nr:FAD-dependent monooxygenase [Nocardia sp. SYP-A9097]MRH88547.1 FAD-dependent oxidoreductase [Nocardia sp. SYP-A9097]
MIYDVIIAGAGPVGLMLASELGLAGVRPLVLERLTEPSTEHKANGLVGQVVPMMDRRGLYERLGGPPGRPQPNSNYFMFAALPLDLSLLERSPVYNMAVPQPRIVEVLRERALELGAEIRWGAEIIDIAQDDDGVSVEISDAEGTHLLHTRYLVGADGGHSLVRKRAGIDFPGVSYDRTTGRTVHAAIPAEWVDPATGSLRVPGVGDIRPFMPIRTERGGFAYAPFPGRSPLLNTTEWDRPAPDGPLTLEEMQASIAYVLGAEVPLAPPTGPGEPALRRQLGGNTRVAAQFRDRRIFLAGDAAHVLVFGGGPGLNLGLQDAMNLGWKLAAEIDGRAPAGLLDSYDTERRMAARRAVLQSQAQATLLAPGADVTAMREVFAELLTDRSTVQRLADLISGSDIRYDMGEPDPHPLVGWPAPDLDLRVASGTHRLAELTRAAKPLLLDFSIDGSFAAGLRQWGDRVEIVVAEMDEPPATALLLRPDSYVAWACNSARPNTAELEELRSALARWLGPVPVAAV